MILIFKVYGYLVMEHLGLIPEEKLYISWIPKREDGKQFLQKDLLKKIILQ